MTLSDVYVTPWNLSVSKSLMEVTFHLHCHQQTGDGNGPFSFPFFSFLFFCQILVMVIGGTYIL